MQKPVLFYLIFFFPFQFLILLQLNRLQVDSIFFEQFSFFFFFCNLHDVLLCLSLMHRGDAHTIRGRARGIILG